MNVAVYRVGTVDVELAKPAGCPLRYNRLFPMPMKAKHQTTLHARCPYAPVWDYYNVTVETNNFMRCEKLQDVCDEIRGKEMTQEDVFQHIRDGIKNQGSTVTVEGRHGQNGRLVISG